MNRRSKSGRDKKYLRSKRNSHMRRKTLKRRKINKTLRKRTLKRKNTKRSNRGGGFGYQCGKTWGRNLGTREKERLTTIHAVKNKTRKGLLDYTTYDILLPEWKQKGKSHEKRLAYHPGYKISDLKFKDIKALKNILGNEISALKSLPLNEMDFWMHVKGTGEACRRRFQQINDVFVAIKNYINNEDSSKRVTKINTALLDIGKQMEVYEPAPKTTPKPAATGAIVRGEKLGKTLKGTEKALEGAELLRATAAATRKAEKKKRANQWFRKIRGLKHLANLVDPISPEPETTSSTSISRG